MACLVLWLFLLVKVTSFNHQKNRKHSTQGSYLLLLFKFNTSNCKYTSTLNDLIREKKTNWYFYSVTLRRVFVSPIYQKWQKNSKATIYFNDWPREIDSSESCPDWIIRSVFSLLLFFSVFFSLPLRFTTKICFNVNKQGRYRNVTFLSK